MWCQRNAQNYQENDALMGNGFTLLAMLKACRSKFLSFFDSAHVTRKLCTFLFWKFHWVWRDLGGMPRIIKKITGFWKIVLGSRQCQKCVHWAPWVFLALLTLLGNHINCYFRNLTEFDVISEEDPKLSRKSQIYGKLF